MFGLAVTMLKAMANQQMRENVLHEHQSEQLPIGTELPNVHRDGAIDQPREEHEIHAEPLDLRKCGTIQRQPQPQQKDHDKQDQNPAFEANVV
jgi:hypothetical protein